MGIQVYYLAHTSLQLSVDTIEQGDQAQLGSLEIINYPRPTD